MIGRVLFCLAVVAAALCGVYGAQDTKLAAISAYTRRLVNDASSVSPLFKPNAPAEMAANYISRLVSRRKMQDTSDIPLDLLYCVEPITSGECTDLTDPAQEEACGEVFSCILLEIVGAWVDCVDSYGDVGDYFSCYFGYSGLASDPLEASENGGSDLGNSDTSGSLNSSLEEFTEIALNDSIPEGYCEEIFAPENAFAAAGVACLYVVDDLSDFEDFIEAVANGDIEDKPECAEALSYLSSPDEEYEFSSTDSTTEIIPGEGEGEYEISNEDLDAIKDLIEECDAELTGIDLIDEIESAGDIEFPEDDDDDDDDDNETDPSDGSHNSNPVYATLVTIFMIATTFL